ncbi:MAG: hypothetical protein J3R72DRAFT_123545, partial [Linnemannia gamsii]
VRSFYLNSTGVDLKEIAVHYVQEWGVSTAIFNRSMTTYKGFVRVQSTRFHLLDALVRIVLLLLVVTSLLTLLLLLLLASGLLVAMGLGGLGLGLGRLVLVTTASMARLLLLARLLTALVGLVGLSGLG